MKRFHDFVHLKESSDSVDIYGFNKIPSQEKPVKEDDSPIQQLKLSQIVRSLLKRKMGDIIPTDRFGDEVRWGETVGAVSVKFTPNWRAIISQLTKDGNGNPTWICKQFYRISDEAKGYEDSVATDLFKEVEEIAKGPVETPVKGWKHLEDLTQWLSRGMRTKIPDLFVYDAIRKISDHEYIINFSLRNSGVGKISRRYARTSSMSPYLEVNISYEAETGVVRVVLTTISIDAEGSSWDVDVPFFDEKFSPTQPKEEILKVIVTSLRYF